MSAPMIAGIFFMNRSVNRLWLTCACGLYSDFAGCCIMSDGCESIPVVEAPS